MSATADRDRCLHALSSIFAVGCLAACTPLALVAPYDEVIYSGLTQFKESLNNHVKNVSDLGGTPQGTHAANKIPYNELETRIDMLIDRASLQATDNRCSISSDLAEGMNGYARSHLPAELVDAPVTDEPNTFGCTRRLLEIVREQLAIIEEIHRDIDRCAAAASMDAAGAVEYSCLRPATARDALAIANQSINAAWFLENAKKQGSQ